MKVCKFSKSTRIFRELQRKKRELDLYCEINNVEPSEYMKGSKRIIDHMMLFTMKIIKDND